MTSITNWKVNGFNFDYYDADKIDNMFSQIDIVTSLPRTTLMVCDLNGSGTIIDLHRGRLYINIR